MYNNLSDCKMTAEQWAKHIRKYSLLNIDFKSIRRYIYFLFDDGILEREEDEQNSCYRFYSAVKLKTYPLDAFWS